MSIVELSDHDVVWLIMQYYRSNKLYDSLLTVALESNVSLYEDNIGEEILYLQRLILEGRWDAVHEYVRPLQRGHTGMGVEISFLIQRQEYLEALSHIGAGGQIYRARPGAMYDKDAALKAAVNAAAASSSSSASAQHRHTSAGSGGGDAAMVSNMDYVVQLLKRLEKICPSRKAFDSLCYCLTLERLTDNKEYSEWSVAGGRIEAVDRIYGLIRNVIPQQQPPTAAAADGKGRHPQQVRGTPSLLVMLSMAVKYQYQHEKLQQQLHQQVAGFDMSEGDDDDTEAGQHDDDSDTEGDEGGSDGGGRGRRAKAARKRGPSSSAAAGVEVMRLPSRLSTYYDGASVRPVLGAAKVLPASDAGDGYRDGEELHEVQGEGEGDAEEFDEDPLHPQLRLTQPIARHRADGLVTLPAVLRDQGGDGGAGADMEEGEGEQGALAAERVDSYADENTRGAAAGHAEAQSLGDVARSGAADSGAQRSASVTAAAASVCMQQAVSSKPRQGASAPPSSSILSAPPANPISHRAPVAWTVPADPEAGADGLPSPPAAAPTAAAKAKSKPSGGVIVDVTDTTTASTTNISMHYEKHKEQLKQKKLNKQHQKGGASPRHADGPAAPESRHQFAQPPPLPAENDGQHSRAMMAQPQPQLQPSQQRQLMEQQRREHEELQRKQLQQQQELDRQLQEQAEMFQQQQLAEQKEQERIANQQKLQRKQLHQQHNMQPQVPQRSQWTADSSSGNSSRAAGSFAAVESALLLQANCPLRCVSVAPPSIANLIGHEGDGAVFVVGSNDKALRIMQCPSSADAFGFASNSTAGPAASVLQHLPDVHKGSVYCCDINSSIHSNRGADCIIASGSNDKSVKLTRLIDGRLIGTLKGHNGTIRALSYNNSSNNSSSAENDPSGGSIFPQLLLASAGAGDCKPRIWDVNTGQCVATLTAHKDAVHGLAWIAADSKDKGSHLSGVSSNILLTGDEGGVLMAHDIRTGTAIAAAAGSGGQSCFLWSQHIGAGICTLAAATPEWPERTGNRSSSVYNVSTLIAAGCTDGAVVTFDASATGCGSGGLLKNTLHGGDVRALTFLNVLKSSSNRTKTLLTTSFDCKANIWQVSQRGSARTRGIAAGCGDDEGDEGGDGAAEKVSDLFINTSSRGNNALSQPAVQHEDKILSCAVDWSTEDVITSGADGRVILWRSAGEVGSGGSVRGGSVGSVSTGAGSRGSARRK